MSYRKNARRLSHLSNLTAITLCLAMAAFPLAQSTGRVVAQGRADGRAESSYSKARLADSQDRARELNVYSLEATLARGGVILQWHTNFELDNLGFDIYRVRNGQRFRANRSLVLGSVFNVGAGMPLRAGYSYSWFDAAGTSDSVYYIESLSADGTRKLHEIGTAVSRDKEDEQAPEYLQTESNNSAVSDPARLVNEYPSSVAGVQASQGTLQDQWAIAGQSALKIQIKKDGWYRVTQQQIAAAGFIPIVDIQNLSLYLNAQEIAIRTSQSSGQFGNGDYLEFYGQGLDTKESDTRIYYLIAGTQPGRRMSSQTDLTSQANLPEVNQDLNLNSPTAAKSYFEYQGLFAPLVNILDGRTPSSGRDETEKKPSVLPADEKVAAPIPKTAAVDSILFPRSTTTNTLRADETKTLAPATNEPSPALSTSTSASSTSVRHSRSAAKSRRRRAGRKANAVKRRYAHASDQAASSVLSFNNTVQITERVNYIFSLLNGDAQNYFGQPVYAFGTAKATLVINNIQSGADGPAVLEVAVQGVSATNHVVSVFFNDVLLGTISPYFGFEHGVQSFNIPLSQVLEGNNTVKMTAGSGDTGLVDYVRLTYPHSYIADSNSLRFSLRSAQTAKVDGFTVPSVLLLDITDPTKVTTNTLAVTSGSITVPPAPKKKARAPIFKAPERQPLRTVYALPDGQFLQPAGLSLNQPSSLNLSANGADLLIISYKDFIPSLSKNVSPINTTFVAQRLSQGLTSQIVDVEDVYDEFSYGTHTGQALVDFLSRAASTWTKKPRYLLLLGDASYDPRNFEQYGNWDLVPTRHVDTLFEDTCTDELLADFDGDGISDIPLGRLPARTVTEADLMLSKIVNFSKANVPQTAMLVADAQDGYYFNFADSNVAIAALLPQPPITVQFVNRGESHTPSTDAATRTTIINKFNQGVALANYSGHGNVDTWTGASIFTAPDARGLTNGNKLTFVVVADCLNGLFDDRALEGIGEAFIKAPLGGAVATFSSSGKTTPEGQQAMAQRMYQLIYGSTPTALGDAIKEAKTATPDMDVRHTWILLGDPTMKIW